VGASQRTLRHAWPCLSSVSRPAQVIVAADRRPAVQPELHMLVQPIVACSGLADSGAMNYYGSTVRGTRSLKGLGLPGWQAARWKPAA
jgi:hypothetical protein